MEGKKNSERNKEPEPPSPIQVKWSVPNNPQLGMQLGRFKNRTPAQSLRVHLVHLISIMSFKLGYVSIPKRRIFLPLFLFCAYDSSVLQNFKIFTHLLPNFSYKDPRMTEVTYHCIYFNDRVRKVPKIKIWNFSDPIVEVRVRYV